MHAIKNVIVSVAPSDTISTSEITVYVLFGLGLTTLMAFKTLSHLDFKFLAAYPKDRVLEMVEEKADDLLIEGISDKLEVLCDKAGVPLPNGPYLIIDLMFHSGDDFEVVRAAYHDLLAEGLMSHTYLYAMNLLAIMQAQGLAV